MDVATKTPILFLEWTTTKATFPILVLFKIFGTRLFLNCATFL